MSLLQNSNAISVGGAYDFTDSVRLRSSATAYLERTPASSGSRTTWTYSVWFKRGNTSGYQYLLSAGTNATNDTLIYLHTTDGSLYWGNRSSSSFNSVKRTSNLFRDSSAWYHVVLVWDTTNGTADDRMKIYVNGDRVTSFQTSTNPPSSQTSHVNNNVIHCIGSDTIGGTYTFDGYLTEVNFVDGQALTASDFGEYDDDTGVWKPKEYTGTYGTNGFYLPMKATTQAEGFNTVTYTGTGTAQNITGVGFQPDLIWIKNRTHDASAPYYGNNHLYDSIRGPGYALYSNDSGTGYYLPAFMSSFDADGFTVEHTDSTNYNGDKYVAWCWEAGGTAVSNNDGDIASSVSANTAKGFSVVTYTSTTNAKDTVGHGLGSAPKIVINKKRNATNNWTVVTDVIDGSMDYLYLNTTDTALDASSFADAPTSSLMSSTFGSAADVVAYCFAEVSGFSKFGSYTGTGSAGNFINTGFRPAMVIIKRTDTVNDWWILDNVRENGVLDGRLLPNKSDAEAINVNVISYANNGFYAGGASGESNTYQTNTNDSGGTYIYMAFADTRDFQWNFDASGNKNNWYPTNINSNASSETTYDIMSDVPTLTDADTCNYPTFNPIDNYTATGQVFVSGNLNITHTGTTWTPLRASMSVSTGKWYWEVTAITAGNSMVGIIDVSQGLLNASYPGAPAYPSGTAFGYYNNGTKYGAGSVGAGYGASWTNGDIIGVALDLDAGTLTYYKNNVSQGVAFSSISGNFAPANGLYNTSEHAINFGQRPFAYTPPTGYKKLNTYNLPDSAIKDGSEYMKVVTYTGNNNSGSQSTGSSQSITVGWTPDLIWTKCRSAGLGPQVFDSIRGATYRLGTDSTSAENSGVQGVTSFDSTGYTVGPDWGVNLYNATYVGWNWRGSDSTAATISAGSIDGTNPTIASTVSANTTSGFSIVTYTGNGSSGTVGHGLGSAPTVYIIKNRSASADWIYFTTQIDGSVDFLSLNTTGIKYNASEPAPTSSIFTLGSSATTINASGNNYVAYCFAEVEGFSKFGSYVGNGSTDGPFVYTGFKPAFIMFKATNDISHWTMVDTARSTYNVIDDSLYADTYTAELTTITDVDSLSNGFKWRGVLANETNVNGYTYIYMAFASNPFKHSLAH